jgi:monoamine oxidase
MHDTIVIGAGAAGLAATRALQQAGSSVLTLEARERIGGRILTDFVLAPHPVELGAEFIHGEHVHSWELVRSAGLQTTEVFSDAARYFLYAGGELISLPDVAAGRSAATLRALSLTGQGVMDAVKKRRLAAQRLLCQPRSRVMDAVKKRRQQGCPDVDVASLLRTLDISAGTDFGRIVEGSYQGLNAADPPELSAFSLDEADYTGDGDRDFRIDDGYSTWLTLFARNLPVRLSSPVELVRWQRDGVELITSRGEVFRARRAIVTLPLALLQAGHPRFLPRLPPEKSYALEQLGSGPITKLVLRFDRPFWPAQMERVSTPLNARFLWRTGAGRKHEVPVLTVYAGASAARALNRLGPEGALRAVLTDLRTIFGLPRDPAVLATRFVDWAADPFAGLGYSFVRPGGVGARALLAAPTEKVLFWAGEATNPVRPATVHGAVESGIRAAEEALRAGSG